MFKASVLCVFVLHCYYPCFLSGEELINLQQRQRFQQEFDDEYFEINSGFEKIRHILLHLVKTTGKMAAYCESMEHGKEADPYQVVNEALPDLLIHAFQIANYYQVDLGEKYSKRIQFIINRAKSNEGKRR